MFLTEVVKTFIKNPKTTFDRDSSVVKPDSLQTDLTNPELTYRAGAFFDNLYDEFRTNINQDANFASLVQEQANKIDTYRQVATDSDVSNAIDEIVDEVVFAYDQKNPLKLSVNLENEKLVEAIQNCFNDIEKKMKLSKNLKKLVRNSYIDGQLVLHIIYDKKSTKSGIKGIQIIDPKYFYYDATDGKYKYFDNYNFRSQSLYEIDKFPQIFDNEEILRTDFGLHYNGLNYSYLEYALKTANMLKTLEDLLIPLRFSRSVSRRVFNVDVGDLPTKRASELIRQYQEKFKYKKFYNSQTGEITNQQHIVSMVEDYWFPNRSGAKGTQVELLNESEGLGELDDILYFAKKLYRAMNVPANRIDYDPNSNGGDFSFNTDTITRADLRFYSFISGIRPIYTDVLKELLHRQIVATGIMTDKEWHENEEAIEIEFTNSNVFMEKMKNALFNERVDYYHNVSQDMTKLFSVRTILTDIFRMSDEEIDEEMEKIAKESKDSKFAQFYQANEGF